MDNVPDRYLAAVRDRVADEVLAVASFVRAGLPQSFLIAVTPSRVHAFAYASREVGLRVESELADWDRATLRADVERVPSGTRLTLSPGDAETVVCEGRDGALTESVLALLAQPR